MAIGRSDVRHTQRGHTGRQGRHGVWAPDAEPIRASGDVPRQQVGNDRLNEDGRMVDMP